MPDPSSRHPWFAHTGTPRVLAHRGLATPDMVAAGVAENSFAALAAAHAAGAAYIESDCHLTRDGTAVLFHDEDLVRVTGDPRRVDEVSAVELETIMAARGGLVTLRQALEAFPTVRFNIDVKADAAASPAGTIIAAHAERVLLTSFDDDRRLLALAAALAANPSQRPATSGGSRTIARLLRALLLRSTRAVTASLKDIDAVQIPERHSRVKILSSRLLDAAHRHGVEVHVWTVNEVTDMARLAAVGVDGIVTDRADVALSHFPADVG